MSLPPFLCDLLLTYYLFLVRPRIPADRFCEDVRRDAALPLLFRFPCLPTGLEPHVQPFFFFPCVPIPPIFSSRHFWPIETLDLDGPLHSPLSLGQNTNHDERRFREPQLFVGYVVDDEFLARLVPFLPSRTSSRRSLWPSSQKIPEEVPLWFLVGANRRIAFRLIFFFPSRIFLITLQAPDRKTQTFTEKFPFENLVSSIPFPLPPPPPVFSLFPIVFPPAVATFSHLVTLSQQPPRGVWEVLP